MRTDDHQRDWCLDVRSLGRQAGSMQEHDLEIPLAEPFGTEVIGVPAGSAIQVHVRLEAVTEGVYASGMATSLAEGSCVRCLEPVKRPVAVRFQEMYAYPDRAAHLAEVGADSEDEVSVLQGDTLDLQPVIRDAVVPALPFQPVCREDCAGLCVDCGVPLAENPGHQHESIDPRWAALTDLASPASQEKRN